MLPLLQIQLLGGWRVTCGDEPISGLDSARPQALLAYLILHRNTVLTRQQLAFLFWPETTDAQAQTNLRQLLHTLRRRLPHADGYLELDGKTLGWRTQAPVVSDLERFELAFARAQAAGGSDQLERLAEAAGFYTGDLLPQCYDDWILPIRERLAQQYAQTLAQLAHLHEERREYTAAVTYAQRLLHHDPLHEATYRQLMRLHALNGDRAAALRVYHTCVTVLERELDVPPRAATREAYEQLLRTETVQPPSVRSSSPPLVGRQPEWQRLQAAWRSAGAGTPHMVCLAGEAGIGKTRLAEEMVYWAQQQGIATVSARAYAAEARLAYAVIAQCLVSEGLQGAVAQMDTVWLRELSRLRPDLLAVYPQLPPPEPLLDPWQRQHLFEALARVFVVAERPLLLVLDDLQWCDEESLEWLHYLMRFHARARLLVLVAVRREEVDSAHPLTRLLLALHERGQLAEVTLSRLDVRETSELAHRVAQKALDEAAAQQLFRVTDGNPLYIVEMIRAGWTVPADGAGGGVSGGVGGAQLPPKVQATIEARLAQLSTAAQELVEAAAVIGRSFTFGALSAICEQDELRAVRSLDELWLRQIIREQGVDTYDFTHDRIREVAYRRISPARRRMLHRRVVAALEQLPGEPGEPGDSRSIQLAHHCEQGGFLERAIYWLQRAADAARAVYAHHDAVRLLEHAVILLQQLPVSAAQRETELELQLALCAEWDHVSSHLGGEVEAAYQRALALCRQVPHTPHLFRVLWGLHETALYRTDYQSSLALASQCLQIAETTQDSNLLLQAHHAMWGPYFFLGCYDEAFRHMQAGLAVYDAALHEPLTVYFGMHDAASCALTLSPLAAWNSGDIDQAHARLEAAVTHAHRLTQPLTIGDAFGFCAFNCYLLRDPARAERYAEPPLRIFGERQMLNAQLMGVMCRGWSLAMQGQIEEGLTLVRRSMQLCKQSRQLLFISQLTCMFAETCLAGGQAAEGLAAVADGIDLFHRYRDLICAPDLYLLQGKALEALGASAHEVENAFVMALSLARELGAKVSELRAATCLAQLHRRQGRSLESLRMLQEVYASFTEGFDTPDLLAAAAVLDERAVDSAAAN